ncbi:MAG: hypothetical protein CFH32_00273 [Alphaproteobacteria bacterium MarineAlpha9_Bin2]|nr:MAG: hypothetical protein CFH32_00273 [Alphaproteobacteria bacterium MarineAlpha9_Bin2]
MFLFFRFLLPLLFLTHFLYADEMTSNKQKSLEAIKELGSSLKSSLQMVMKESGPIAALEYCNVAAQDITKELSDTLQLKVRRTSLKTRNKNNIPDDWEQKSLSVFTAQYISGEEIKNMYFHEIVTTNNNDRIYRFIKPIPTGKVCLTCHGSNISSELADKIKELYPNDKATGFKAGEIRGAFSVIVTLD